MLNRFFNTIGGNTVWIWLLSLGLWSCGNPGDENATVADANRKLPEKIDYNFHIKPILSDRCFACHGPDKNKIEAGLRLDTKEGTFGELPENEGHFAVVSGDPEKSELHRRIFADDPDETMPPPESNLELSEYEKKLLTKWIEQGAEFKEHWSLLPPEKVKLPKVEQQDWVKNPIDQFVLANLESKGLAPSAPATKEMLLRRVSFDLTGLPPSVEELNDFLADDSPKAYEKVVDWLLASPAYGERMAAIWLDASRYADSHGYQDDRPRTMWPWRDWVVKAFNKNLPYDQFATWQLAGDLLPNATYEQVLATGFNRNHAITQEGGIIEEEYLAEYAADRVNTFSTTFLGLTVECARCHDHKYDPITQKDYYQLFDFFNNIPEKGRIDYNDLSPEPSIKVQDAELDSTIAYIQTRITHFENEVHKKEKIIETEFFTWLKDDFENEDFNKAVTEKQEAYYKLDILEADQFYSDEGNDQPALMNPGLPASIPFPKLVFGKPGHALQFDGSNYLTLGDIGDFEHYHHFSYGGWIKSSQNFKRNAGIFSRRNGELNRQGYDLVLTPDHKLSARIINRDGENYIQVTTKAAVPKNQWQHAFVTYDGSSKASGLRIYLNGQNQAVTVNQDNLDYKSILNGNDFLVGHWSSRNQTTDTYGFEGGSVDEVRVYDRTLTPLEVQVLAEKDPHENYANLPVAAITRNSPLYQHFLMRYDKTYAEDIHTLDTLRRTDFYIPNVMVMQELDTPKETHIMLRGSYAAPGEKVVAGTPEAVLPFPDNLPKNRLGLAKWLVSEKNPLTARVAVNRFWQLIFGKGLVRTPEDFGNQGALPSHPELLDWLAVRFRESGWDVKAIQKMMVMSATYQQSSRINKKLQKMDPENVWLARGPNARLSAEMFRDNALAVSGLLKEKVGGKWVKPYQPSDIWKALANQIGENKYRPSEGNGLYRRSLYTYWKRTIPPPTMLMFDAPERTLCAVKRQSTSTPLQSLVLLNDPQYMEASRKLAERMIREGGDTPENQVIFGFRAVTSRMPKPEEMEILLTLYQEELSRFSYEDTPANELMQIGDSDYDTKLNKEQLAALAVVANTLLNLDEAKFRG